MILLQAIDAANMILESSKEQTYLVFFQTAIIMALSWFAWWLLQKVESKNKEVHDCLKEQINTDAKMANYAKMVDSHLATLNRSINYEDPTRFIKFYKSFKLKRFFLYNI